MPDKLVIAATHAIDTSSDSDTNDVVQPPKEFLAKSLAESLFNGLLRKVRNKGIPRQKGFIHLSKVNGYGDGAVTLHFAKENCWPPIPCKNLLRTTKKLTVQSVQEACDKERQRRIKELQQKGIQFYMPIMVVLDEYRRLVRDAKKREDELSDKDLAQVQGNWSVVVEEIRNRGLLGNIGRQVEQQRRDTLHTIWANMENRADRSESLAMASVHNLRRRVHEDLKCAVRKIMDQAKSEGEAVNLYYSDLNDQVIRALNRRVLGMQNVRQMAAEVKHRLQENHDLNDDPLRLKVISAREDVHRDLQALLAKVKNEERERELKIVKKQEALRDSVLQEVVHSYWRKRTQNDFAQSKIDKLQEEKERARSKDPKTNEAKQHWHNLQQEVVLTSRKRLQKPN